MAHRCSGSSGVEGSDGTSMQGKSGLECGAQHAVESSHPVGLATLQHRQDDHDEAAYRQNWNICTEKPTPGAWVLTGSECGSGTRARTQGKPGNRLGRF